MNILYILEEKFKKTILNNIYLFGIDSRVKNIWSTNTLQYTPTHSNTPRVSNKSVYWFFNLIKFIWDNSWKIEKYEKL